MNKRLIRNSILMLLVSGNIFISKGQETKFLDPSLQGQYKELLEKSNNIVDIKNFKDQLSLFWKSSKDTIQEERLLLAKANAQLQIQTKDIKSLKQNLAIRDKDLLESKTMVNEVKLLGISVSKSSYQIIIWGLIAGLSTALSVLIFLSRGYRKEAKYRITLFKELSEEFQSHKIKANEKEKRLARELQTEKNRLEQAGFY